ncbi:MAG: hypothetical protein AB1529_00080 [Candidatus Micrarchaeota archaeon]
MRRGRKREEDRMGYRDSEPDVTSTGIGKTYDGFRMFHSRKGLLEHISSSDGALRAATDEEAAQFRKDLARAAAKDSKVAKYLGEFPELREDLQGEGTHAALPTGK